MDKATCAVGVGPLCAAELRPADLGRAWGRGDDPDRARPQEKAAYRLRAQLTASSAPNADRPATLARTVRRPDRRGGSPALSDRAVLPLRPTGLDADAVAMADRSAGRAGRCSLEPHRAGAAARGDRRRGRE